MAKKCPIIKVPIYFALECEDGDLDDLGLLKEALRQKLMEEIPDTLVLKGSWFTGDRQKARLLSTEEALDKLRKDASS
jgi:hypothetical protein